MFLAILGYLLTVEIALPPDAEAATPASLISSAPKAQFQLAGTDRILTGSVDSLFAGSVFAGPNTSQKQARARTPKSSVEVASTFDTFRNLLRSVKMPHVLPDESEPANTPSVEASGPIAVASIVGDPMTTAFAAIRDALRIDPSPVEMPGQLAYARAVAPPSIFDTPVSMLVSDKQFQCLAEAVYFEARGESYRGQVAVAQVVLNRVHSSLYPSTICGVVYQNQSKRNACQFSFACDGISDKVNEPVAWKTAKEVAEKVLRGELYLTEVANATHYHASYVRPDWAGNMRRMTKIGLHIFYRFKWATT